MKPHTLPVKRTPVSKGIFRRLSAVTRSRKQRVAATANEEFENEDHSSKISRALTIIFLIHIVVIGLIFFHQQFLDDDAPQSETVAKKSTAPAAAPLRSLPQLSSGDAIYRVVPGDNYQRIALAQNVEEADLRSANNNVDIVPGLIMKIPPQKSVAIDTTEIPASPAVSIDDGLVDALPVETAGAPRAQPVRTVVERAPVTSAAAEPVRLSGRTHVVQSGDNVWRIANRYKVDQNALMKANGITDPKKLKLGMTLKIPG